MYKGITLNQFIAELQLLAAKHGEDEIASIGSSSGKITGMSSPFCFNFKGHDATEFIPSQAQDVPAPGFGCRVLGVGKVSAKADDLNDRELRHVWARVGMTLDITPEEEKAIFEGDYLEGKKAVMRVIEAGRASVDGETYIPEECIRDFDEEYGTNYFDREEECAWTLDGHYVAMVPEEPIEAVLRMDVSDKEKVRILAGSFEVGQEFAESNGERHARLKEKLDDGFWKFDVFDRNGARLYETSAYAPALAREVLSGKLKYLGMEEKDKIVSEVLADAEVRQGEARLNVDEAMRDLARSGAFDWLKPRAQYERERIEGILARFERKNEDFER